MILLKINIFINIVFLLTILPQEYFMYPADIDIRIKSCINEITSLFCPQYLPNMLNRRRKQLAKIAFLHFRYSEIPEKDTFTNENGFTKEDAKAYFYHMFSTIFPSPKMEDPIKYCNKRGTRKYNVGGRQKTKERICLDQLLDIGMPVCVDNQEVLDWIYKHLSLDDLVITDNGLKRIQFNFVWSYVSHVATYFQPKEDNMMMPRKFCEKRYDPLEN